MKYYACETQYTALKVGRWIILLLSHSIYDVMRFAFYRPSRPPSPPPLTYSHTRHWCSTVGATIRCSSAVARQQMWRSHCISCNNWINYDTSKFNRDPNYYAIAHGELSRLIYSPCTRDSPCSRNNIINCDNIIWRIYEYRICSRRSLFHTYILLLVRVNCINNYNICAMYGLEAESRVSRNGAYTQYHNILLCWNYNAPADSCEIVYFFVFWIYSYWD